MKRSQLRQLLLSCGVLGMFAAVSILYNPGDQRAIQVVPLAINRYHKRSAKIGANLPKLKSHHNNSDNIVGTILTSEELLSDTARTNTTDDPNQDVTEPDLLTDDINTEKKKDLFKSTTEDQTLVNEKLSKASPEPIAVEKTTTEAIIVDKEEAESNLKSAVIQEESETKGNTTHPPMDKKSMLIYRAYIDHRNPAGTIIRVLVLTRCVRGNTTVSGKIGDHEIKFNPHPIEKKCPWAWASGCKYNSYILESTTNLTKINPKNGDIITLTRDKQTLSVPLVMVSPQKETGITVCIPPLYWYPDWTNVLIFLEVWKAQGVKNFIFYYNSATEEVYSVLKHYEAEGTVTLVNWPEFPSSGDVDPNKSTYRLAHSLAHNDCIMRINTEYGALVDIDEYIVPKAPKKNIYDFVHENFNTSYTVSALSFTHSSLVFSPMIVKGNMNSKDINYNGVLKPVAAPTNYPRKSMFIARTVKLISTHWIEAFFAKHQRSRIVSRGYADLFHSRYTNDQRNGTKQQLNFSPVKILPPTVKEEDFRQTLLQKTEAIFPKGEYLNSETISILGLCLKRWRFTKESCKTPMITCRPEIEPLANWNFAPTDRNDFQVL